MEIFRLSFILMLLLSFERVMAQTGEQNAMLDKYYTVKSFANETETSATRAVGNPFFKEDFDNGYLFFPDHEPLPAEIRYNIEKEEMQVRFEGDQYRVLQDEVLVELENIPFRKYRYRKEGEGPEFTGYFEILTADFQEKPLLLVRKYHKEIEISQRAEARELPGKYKETSDVYLKFRNANSAVFVERRRKNFLSLFPEDQREEIEQFIRDNKLKPRKTEDLHLIVDHFNSK